jgi:hypothetical protein
LKLKYPIEYEVEPTHVEKGIHWLTLKIKNIGVETLRRVDVRLHSTDTFCLTVYGEGHFIAELKPDEQREVVTRVSVSGSANVHATIDARKKGEFFWWDSGYMSITVIEEKAKIERFFVLSNPYTSIGKALDVEATIKGLQNSEGLTLEFLADTPSGKYEELAKIETSELAAGDEARYTAEITPKETGYYTVYVYLYDGWRRIDHKTNTIYVQR